MEGLVYVNMGKHISKRWHTLIGAQDLEEEGYMSLFGFVTVKRRLEALGGT